MGYKSDIEIAREAKMLPIQQIGAKLDIPEKDLLPFGHDKAKISAEFIKAQRDGSDGKLILVTAINPTPAGEGKTTTTVGLGDGLNALGKKAMICIREASLGPCFGMKGGAAGGGYAQVVPMEEMNLHFTGDFHAITSAHNLLSAMIDNHIYWGNELEIDQRRVTWRRVVDMNDRALRDIVTSLGGVSNGFPRQAGFDITVASEVMAILCLALDIEDLQKRLGDIIVAYRRDRTPVYCRDIKADGAMTVLLSQAMQPNLVQTLENNPAFVHGGPFANIAHGCNSVVATTTALKLADYVVTEAGFGADLGAEKFMNIKCRKAGIAPSVVVLVATVRAMKMNGGVAKADLGGENVAAVQAGCPNLGRHIENMKSFGVPVVVAVNHFVNDTDAEVEALQHYVAEQGAEQLFQNTGSMGPKERWILPREWLRLPTPIWRILRQSIPMKCHFWRRLRLLPSGFTALMKCSPIKRSVISSNNGKIRDMAICLFAWQRPNTASARIRHCVVRQQDIVFRSARYACLPEPASLSLSAVRS